MAGAALGWTDPEDAARYAAIGRRDAAFFYGVKTTGVYCRAGCASRRPLPGNVSFYASCAEAERAGFRACKRCRPDEVVADRRLALVKAACRAMDAAEEAPTLAVLAAAAGLSPFHFHRMFSQVMGITPRAYADALRAGRVRAGLAAAPSVTAAFYDAGFGGASRFYEAAGARLGMTPRAWRRGGAGETIRFAVAEGRLGAVLVAATGRGICAISLGDDPAVLVRGLQDRFFAAELIGGDAAFEALVAQVVGWVEAPGSVVDLPLDMRGTAFQQRVWQALRAIPAGTTLSYAAVAEAIGAPGAMRAVAGACAANALAVAVPCHRVVRADGSAGGYRWGVARKQALLALEAGAG